MAEPPADGALIRQKALDLGFVLAGVTSASPSLRENYVRRWLDAGKHGQMEYLARNVDARLDPGKLLEGAKSVICVADAYPAAAVDMAEPPRGRVARYAWGDDYHKIIRARLFRLADALRQDWPKHTFRSAVDTAPILEREHAVNAGLGWIGKNTMLINRHLGSWLLLGQIVTTLDITLPAESAPEPDRCGKCDRCVKACPTGCIGSEGYELDAGRCISYLTIEHRGEIDPGLHGAIGDWVAGCDVCQEVCPFNKSVGEAGAIDYQPGYALRPPGPAISLMELLDWNTDTRQKALKRSALKRIKLDMFKRNALIATGNHLAKAPDEPLRRRVEQIAADPAEPDLVRLTARQAAEA